MGTHDKNATNTALFRRLTTSAVAMALALVCAGTTAHADDEGTVLDLAGGDIYIDLGARDGVGAGSTLTLLHVIVAKNPVTGRQLRDRFPLGQLRVIKSGDHVCIARAKDELLKRVRVGDEVELASAPRKFEDPWTATIEQRKRERLAKIEQQNAPPPSDPAVRAAAHKAAVERAKAIIGEAEAAKAVWSATLGKAPQDRIAMWKAFLAANPNSRYAAAVRAEIDSMNAQIQAETTIAEQLVEPNSQQSDLRIQRLASLETDLDLNAPLVIRPPSTVYQGSDVRLSFTILAPQAVDRAWLYYRTQGEGSFHRTNLQFDGDSYMRGAIPADAVAPPALDYFVEIAGPGQDSAPSPVIGSQEFPKQLTVQKAVEDTPPDTDDRSRVTLFTDYVDFDGGLGNGFDQYIHAEVDFMYRFLQPIYAVRVGFGTLGGIGGPKDIIDEAAMNDCIDPTSGQYRCRLVTFTYAYTEFEYRLKNQPISVMIRPQFGYGSSDSRRDTNMGDCFSGQVSENDCEIFSSLGLRLRVRIGDERKTNLTLGFGATQEVGTVFEAAYSWDVIPKFPIKISAQVTDQPVPEDFGVRVIGDVGWRRYNWIYPSIRLAYQARDVDHAGLSGGAAINLDW